MSFGLNTDPSLIHGGELGTLNKFGGCNKRYPGSGKLMERGKLKKKCVSVSIYIRTNQSENKL